MLKDAKSINRSKSLEILMVDDDPIIRLIHRRILLNCELGYPLLPFSDGKEAINYIEEHQDDEMQFLVLLDINMPVLNGWEFLQECRRSDKAKNVYIVLLTSSINKEDKMKALGYPRVVKFVEKPFSESKVFELTELSDLEPFFGSSPGAR